RLKIFRRPFLMPVYLFFSNSLYPFHRRRTTYPSSPISLPYSPPLLQRIESIHIPQNPPTQFSLFFRRPQYRLANKLV
ncbi:hypothetical protein, partial [Neisseria sp. HMSC064E01]|uniref:hypothetical protein n=1 Tax=Neisseria sp. HMSC064E01 TaxID=1715052 RepID=UPI001AEFE24C